MHFDTLLLTVRSVILAAERRASARAETVRALLKAGVDSGRAERELFCELDGLAVLRQRFWALEAFVQGASLDRMAA